MTAVRFRNLDFPTLTLPSSFHDRCLACITVSGPFIEQQSTSRNLESVLYGRRRTPLGRRVNYFQLVHVTYASLDEVRLLMSRPHHQQRRCAPADARVRICYSNCFCLSNFHHHHHRRQQIISRLDASFSFPVHFTV